MQVHNWTERQVFWSLTKFNKGTGSQIGIGIGNDPDGGSNIDYTFTQNGNSYEVRRLAIFVKYAVAAIASVQVSPNREMVLVELDGDLALGAVSRLTAEIEGASVTQVESVGEKSLRLHVSGLSAGSSSLVTLRNVETAKGVLDAISARFVVPTQVVPDFLGSVAEASSYTPILATAGEHLDGNLEFWSNNYGQVLGLAGIGGDAGTYKVLAIGPDGASFSNEATLTVIRDGTVLHLR